MHGKQSRCGERQAVPSVHTGPGPERRGDRKAPRHDVGERRNGPVDDDVPRSAPAAVRTAEAEAQGWPAGDAGQPAELRPGYDLRAISRRGAHRASEGSRAQNRSRAPRTPPRPRRSTSTGTAPAARAPERCRSTRPSTRARPGPTATTAGAFTQFSLTFGREDREQDLSGVQVHMPPGLVGKIAAVKQCGEAEVQAAEETKANARRKRNRHGDRRRRPGSASLLPEGEGLPDRPLQGRAVRSGGRHPGGRRAVQPRQHRRPLGDQRSTRTPRRSRSPRTPCRSSGTACSCGCARSTWK